MTKRSLLAAALGFFLFAAAPASAATFQVTGQDDSVSTCTGSLCPTLRGALAAAESSPGADRIDIPAGTYQLDEGRLDVDSEVALVGAGARTTIIRADPVGDRVILVGGTASATISHLTLRDGSIANDDGGNLLNDGGSVVLDHVHVTGGSASSGGGLANRGGVMAVRQSLIDANSASSGGGIANTAPSLVPGAALAAGQLTVTDTTIASNRSFGDGAALVSFGDNANLTSLDRVTVVRNDAGDGATGGLLVEDGGGSIHVHGSILAANTAFTEDNCGSIAPVSDGGNVVSTGSADCGFSGPGDVEAIDPQVAAKADASGETDVFPIAEGSPARDRFACAGADQRDLARPQGAACDAGAYEYAVPAPPVEPPPVPTPTPPVATPTPTPEPVTNRSVAAEPVRGRVLVKTPGSRQFVPLDPSVIGNGSEVDTRNGAVELTTSKGEVATFYDGIFKVSQSGGVTTLTLTEKLAPCPSGKARAAATKPKTRKLWGDGKGKFRTKGQYSAATIRGTKWLVQDGCRYTRTTVATGVVAVRDNVKHKTFVIRKGKSYTARPRR